MARLPGGSERIDKAGFERTRAGCTLSRVMLRLGVKVSVARHAQHANRDTQIATRHDAT